VEIANQENARYSISDLGIRGTWYSGITGNSQADDPDHREGNFTEAADKPPRGEQSLPERQSGFWKDNPVFGKTIRFLDCQG